MSRLDYSYPHAVGTVPMGAAEVVDDHGRRWLLATTRAVPTGLYLWGRADDPQVFRTLPQIRREAGLDGAAWESGKQAENRQFQRDPLT